MILVIAGTTEGREISSILAEKGYPVLVSVTSSYGASLFPTDAPLKILVHRASSDQLKQLIEKENIKLIIDASHPYATEITRNAWCASKEKNISFIRFERKSKQNTLDDKLDHKMVRAENFEEAAKFAADLGDCMFLTIGSKNIEPFVEAAEKKGVRVVARVLPDLESIKKCLAANMKTQDIIAMQGPFSEEMNKAMFKAYHATVMVTKESGEVGGFDAKMRAAAALGLSIVTVKRPSYEGINRTEDLDEVYQKAQEVFCTEG